MKQKKDTFPKKTLFVCVTNLWRTPNGKGEVAPDADYARGCWYVNEDKADQCEWLMAVDRGEIVGMWEIVSSRPIWLSVVKRPVETRDMTKSDPRRMVCNVVDVPDSLRRKYVGQRRRMYGPVGYSF